MNTDQKGIPSSDFVENRPMGHLYSAAIQIRYDFLPDIRVYLCSSVVPKLQVSA